MAAIRDTYVDGQEGRLKNVQHPLLRVLDLQVVDKVRAGERGAIMIQHKPNPKHGAALVNIHFPGPTAASSLSAWVGEPTTTSGKKANCRTTMQGVHHVEHRAAASRV